MSELALINRDSPYLTRPYLTGSAWLQSANRMKLNRDCPYLWLLFMALFMARVDGMSVIFKSSPCLLGEGDRPKGGGGVDGEAVAGATEPLRQPLRVCHLPETSSERI